MLENLVATTLALMQPKMHQRLLCPRLMCLWALVAWPWELQQRFAWPVELQHLAPARQPRLPPPFEVTHE
jgi:hypothetical protein